MDAKASAGSNIDSEVKHADGNDNEVGGLDLEDVMDLLNTLKPYKTAFGTSDNAKVLVDLVGQVRGSDPGDLDIILGALEGNPASTAQAGIADELELFARLSKAMKQQHVSEIVALGESLGII